MYTERLCLSALSLQVRARTSVGYGPYATSKDLFLPSPSVGDTSPINPRNSNAVVVPSVLAVLALVALVVIAVVIAYLFVRYTRRQKTNKLSL